MYGALNDDGQQVGTPFKSSKFGKVFGYEALQKKFVASVGKVKKDNLAERTRLEIIKAMQDIGTKEDFARRLKEADIEVVYRINPEGRLFGITFTALVWAKPFQPMGSTNCLTTRMQTVKD